MNTSNTQLKKALEIIVAANKTSDVRRDEIKKKLESLVRIEPSKHGANPPVCIGT